MAHKLGIALVLLFISPYLYLRATGNVQAVIAVGYGLAAVSVLCVTVVLIQILLKKSTDRTFKLAMLISVCCLSFLIGVSTSMALY